MQLVYLGDFHRQAQIQNFLWLLDWPWLVPELLWSSSLGDISGQGLAETLREELPAWHWLRWRAEMVL